jgi:hypothetical protein
MINSECFHLCLEHFKTLVGKLNSVIADKWPETLLGDGSVYRWAQEHQLELLQQYRDLEAEADREWLAGHVEEFKKVATEWGRVALEIHRLFAAELRRREAA